MTAEGPNYPDVAVEDSSAGTEPWSNESNACADDAAYATTSYYDSGGSGSSAESYYLKCTDFDFSIPVGATIDGIEVEIEAKADYANFGEEPYIYSSHQSPRIVKDGTLEGYGGFIPSDIDTSSTVHAAGGSTDKWSDTWTPADINSTGFGVAIQVYSYCDPYETQIVYVDFVRITVYYTVEDIVGAAAQTLPAMTQAAAGQVVVVGAAAQTLPAMTQAAAGQVVVVGAAAQTLPAMTQAAAGQIITGVTGTAAQTLPAMTQAATGRIITPVDEVSLEDLRIGDPHLSASSVALPALADCRISAPHLAGAMLELAP